MKNTAIICASSNVFAFALYVSLWSLRKNSPQLADASDIYIYGFNWDEKLKNIFRSLGPLTIVDYDLPSGIERTEWIARFTPALYARFEAFALLQKYERVICLDSDILVQQELLQPLQAFKGPVTMTIDDCPTVQNNFSRPIENYDMAAPCYNAGFIVLNKAQLPAPPETVHKWLYAMLKKYALWVYLGDQGLINLMLQEFSIPVQIASPLYNLPASSARKDLKKAYIVHSTGHRKFWCYYFFKFWCQGYGHWRKNGGSPTTVRKDGALWQKAAAKLNPNGKRIFFEICPDGFRYPIKFFIFTVKYLLCFGFKNPA